MFPLKATRKKMMKTWLIEHKEGSYLWIFSSAASFGVPVFGGFKKAQNDSWLQCTDDIIKEFYARGKVQIRHRMERLFTHTLAMQHSFCTSLSLLLLIVITFGLFATWSLTWMCSSKNFVKFHWYFNRCRLFFFCFVSRASEELG